MLSFSNKMFRIPCFAGKAIFIFFILFTLNNNAVAQSKGERSSFSSNWLFKPSIGFGQFYGDISSQNFFEKFSGSTSLALDFSAIKMFSPVFGAGANLFYSGVKSLKDRMGNGAPVNFNVTGNYFDFNVRGYVDFLNLFDTYNIDKRFSLMGSLGIGYGFWSTTLTDKNTGVSISSGQTVGTKYFKTNSFVIPVGLEGSYRFSDNWAVNLGVDFRTVLNDDVDVWNDGYKYDNLLYVKTGIVYYLNYGWNKKHRVKPKINEDECCDEVKPLAPIPVYDYTPVSRTATRKPETKNIDTVNIVRISPALPEGFEYRVQIMAKAKKRENIEMLREKYHLDYPVTEHYQEGLYLYTVGHFDSYNEALKAARRIKAKGVFDAFVTAYRNGKRIPLTKEMMKN